LLSVTGIAAEYRSADNCALVDFDDEAVFEHALDGAIERAGAEAHGAGGAFGHILDDRVAVPVVVGEGHQDVERRGLQREEAVNCIHGGYTRTVSRWRQRCPVADTAHPGGLAGEPEAQGGVAQPAVGAP
jgi:hypothetical protein